MVNPFEGLSARLDRIEGLLNKILSREQTAVGAKAEKALSVPEAKEVLGISAGAIYQNLDKIPHTKHHGRLYFFESELLAYIKSTATTSSVLVPRSEVRKRKSKTTLDQNGLP